MVTLLQRTPATLQKLRALIAELDAIVAAYEIAAPFDALLHVVAQTKMPGAKPKSRS